MRSHSAFKKSSGFTLIELLIVIAIIGVLAAVLLAVINPLEQLARGRDGGRLSTVRQLGNAAQGYFTSNNVYPTVNDTWITTLVTAGEVQTAPTNPGGPGYTAACAGGGNQNDICFNADTTNAVVYELAGAASNKSKCTGGTPTAWTTWSSAAGRAGIVCTLDTSTAPPLGITTFK